MLQFIVLGQIPGTSLQINFDLFLLTALCFGVVIASTWLVSARRAQRRFNQIALSLIAL